MKTHRSLIVKLLFILGVFLMAAACQNAETPNPTPADTGPDPLEQTVEALQAQNAQLGTQVAMLADEVQKSPPPAPTLVPTATSAPTLTPTPGPTVSVPQGFSTSSHASYPGYVFTFDPEVWMVENTAAGSARFLQHLSIEDCEIGIAPATAYPDLLQYYPTIVGRRSWLVEGYELRTAYVHKDLRLDLSISEDEDCIPGQEAILVEMLTQDEFQGAPASTPVAAATDRPPLEGFACEGALPTRLRQGDKALISAGFLWLRSDPIVSDATEVRLFQQYAPSDINITGEAVCNEKVIFWPVSATTLGEGGETFTGWMAESSAIEYFLEVWNLDW